MQTIVSRVLRVGMFVYLYARRWEVTARHAGPHGRQTFTITALDGSAEVIERPLLGFEIEESWSVEGDDGDGGLQYNVEFDRSLWERLSPAVRREALWRYRHAMEVKYGWRAGVHPDATTLPPRPGYDPETTTQAERIARKIDDLGGAGKSASVSTLKRWMGKCDRGPIALVDARVSDVNDRAAVPDSRLVEAMLSVGSSLRDASTVDRIHYRRKVVNELERHGLGAAVPVPSGASWGRLCDSVVGHLYLFGSAHTRQTNVRPKDGWQKMVVGLGYVEIDTSPIDVRLVWTDDDGTPIQVDSVEVTIAIEAATRSVVAWWVSPSSANKADTAMLLAQMLVPEPFRPGWGESVRWAYNQIPFERLMTLDERYEHALHRPVIFPTTLVTDHGSAFVGDHLLAFCSQHGISVVPAPIGEGRAKPIVERAFRTIRTQVAQASSGYRGPNVSERGKDIDSLDGLTVWQMEELLSEYFLCVYPYEPHEGLRHPHVPHREVTPSEMYGLLVQSHGYVHRPFGASDWVRLHPVEYRAVNEKGVRVDYLQYNTPRGSKALAKYRYIDSPITGANGKWPIHYSRNNPTHVWLWDPRDDTYVTIPWVYADMVERPFSHTLVQAIRSDITAAGGDPNDQREIRDGINNYQNKVESLSTAPARAKGRKLNARAARRGAKAAENEKQHGIAPPEPFPDDDWDRDDAPAADLTPYTFVTRPED